VTARLTVLTLALALTAGASGAAPAPGDGVDRGIAYLLARQQADGSWEGHAGITSVVILSLLKPAPAPGAAADAAARGLAYLERWVQPDGGVYQEDVKHYTTAVALLAFAASGEPRYRARIAGAQAYLLRLQAREDNGFPATHPAFGGILIDGAKANLDVTFFAMRALAEAGLSAEHPFWSRALRFVSRCQNARGSNDQPWAGDDGGFVFAPGFSFAGGTTSYGSMTSAGLSAYRDAGLARDDARVEAAFRWLSANFSAAENPGLEKQTLYHSYFYLSTTLRRWGVDTLTDPAGRPRHWAREVAEALLARQRPDGSWANTDDPRWWESRAVLATAFAVRALRESAAVPGGS
jgi:squalene-hopene/tetraprenyl-beta-curcumene cyclase